MCHAFQKDTIPFICLVASNFETTLCNWGHTFLSFLLMNVASNAVLYLMFIGPCIIVIVEEWKTNLISHAILCHFLCAVHVSEIVISIIRSLRICCWITTSVVLFSVRCVLEIWCGWFWVVQAEACKTNTTKYHPQQKLQHTTNWEQDDRSGNSSTESQAPEDGYINVRSMLSA